MNLSDHLSDGMQGLGAWTKLEQSPAVSSHWLEIDGRRVLFLAPGHSSGPGTAAERDFYPKNGNGFLAKSAEVALNKPNAHADGLTKRSPCG